MSQCSLKADGVSGSREEIVSSVFVQNNLWQLININPAVTLESLPDTLASSSTASCSQEVLIFTDLSQSLIIPVTGRSSYYLPLMKNVTLSTKKLKKHKHFSEEVRSICLSINLLVLHICRD